MSIWGKRIDDWANRLQDRVPKRTDLEWWRLIGGWTAMVLITGGLIWLFSR